MSGINYYPSRSETKSQKIISTTSNVVLKASDVGSLYYCSTGNVHVTISLEESTKMAEGARFDFFRATAGDVLFDQAYETSGVLFSSSAGTLSKIRVEKAAASMVRLNSGEWLIIGDIVAS
jgi:hypothetical protein